MKQSIRIWIDTFLNVVHSVTLSAILSAMSCGVDPTETPSNIPDTHHITGEDEETRQVHLTGIREAQRFLNKIPPDRIENHGFRDSADYKRVRVEAPIRMYKAVISEKDGIIRSFQPTTQWRVPLSLDGEWRSLLTVVVVDGSYSVVNLGGASLARELQQKSRQLPKNAIRLHLLRIHETRQDWLGFDTPRNSETNYMPLMNKKRTSVTSLSIISKSHLLSKLKKAEDRTE
jgi:hypothetical protein